MSIPSGIFSLQQFGGMLDALHAAYEFLGAYLTAKLRTGPFRERLAQPLFFLRVIDEQQRSMESAAHAAGCLAAAERQRDVYLVLRDVFSMPVSPQDALGAVEALFGVGMDG
jgi:hypothetical protein